jgi:hypothetical protein
VLQAGSDKLIDLAMYAIGHLFQSLGDETALS